nr:hypothetical protein HK105_001271 [Polyrhizophydium stewartii]
MDEVLVGLVGQTLNELTARCDAVRKRPFKRSNSAVSSKATSTRSASSRTSAATVRSSARGGTSGSAASQSAAASPSKHRRFRRRKDGSGLESDPTLSMLLDIPPPPDDTVTPRSVNPATPSAARADRRAPMFYLGSAGESHDDLGYDSEVAGPASRRSASSLYRTSTSNFNTDTDANTDMDDDDLRDVRVRPAALAPHSSEADKRAGPDGMPDSNEEDDVLDERDFNGIQENDGDDEDDDDDEEGEEEQYDSDQDDTGDLFAGFSVHVIETSLHGRVLIPALPIYIANP